MDEINCLNCMIGDFKYSLCDNCDAMKRRGRAEELEKLIIDAPRWIPCEERLPEEDKDVLITYRYKEGEGDTNNARIEITSYGQLYCGGQKVGDYKHWRSPFDYFESNYEVVAWMPLPEPWKGEKGRC